LGARFIRQGRIDRFYATFVCRSKKLAIEVDGGGTSGEIGGLRRITDSACTDYRVLFFWDIDVLSRTDEVVDEIRYALEQPAKRAILTREQEWPELSWPE
jgi:very-short-patch-repair endonuclease